MARDPDDVWLEDDIANDELVEDEDAPIPPGYRVALAFAIVLILVVLALALRH